MWKSINATTTGRPSSRSTWRTTSAFHPGLGRFVTCGTCPGNSPNNTACSASACTTRWRSPAPDVYRDWHDTLMRYRGAAPDYGAIWVTYFPPHDRAVSARAGAVHALSQEPAGNHQHRRVLLPGGIALFEREASRPSAPPIWKPPSRTTRSANAWTPAGSPCCAGACPSGPYQSPMEDGMLHFHEWYRRVMGERIGNCAA